jgi:hypothetical protein
MVSTTGGYELKGLAYPGRDASFDSNSQVPSGFHNGRTIYYVFGRYPKEPDGDSLKWTPLSRPRNGDPSLLTYQRSVMIAPR